MYFHGPPLPVLHLANPSSKPPSRLERLKRWKEKRKNRNFNKTIRYQSRKVCADNRPRVKGKFVKVGSVPDLSAMEDDDADSDDDLSHSADSGSGSGAGCGAGADVSAVASKAGGGVAQVEFAPSGRKMASSMSVPDLTMLHVAMD